METGAMLPTLLLRRYAPLEYFGLAFVERSIANGRVAHTT
jgi:hypothetical protein